MNEDRWHCSIAEYWIWKWSSDIHFWKFFNFYQRLLYLVLDENLTSLYIEDIIIIVTKKVSNSKS